MNNNKEYNKALKYFSLSKLDDALASILSVRTSFPDNHKALELHAMICFAMKNYADAVVLLEKCFKNDRTNSKIATRLMDVLMAQGNYTRAIEVAHNYQESGEFDHDIQVKLSDAYIANGQTEQAIDYLEYCLAEHPDSARTCHHLSKAYLAANDLDNAKKNALISFKQDGTSRKTLVLLADIYIEASSKGNIYSDIYTLLVNEEINEKLCKALIKTKRLDDCALFCTPDLVCYYNPQTIYQLIKMALDAEMLSYSRLLLEIYYQKEPKANRLITQIGNDCLDAEKNSAAYACFEICFKYEPENSYILRSLGESLLRIGEVDKAVATINSFKRTHVTNVFLEYLLAKAQIKAGNIFEALNSIIFCLDEDPYDYKYNSLAGYIYFRLGNLDLALKHSMISFKAKSSENYNALDNLAQIHIKMNDLSRAEKYYEMAIKEYPDTTTLLIRFAQLKIRQGMLSAAYDIIRGHLNTQIAINTACDILSAAIEADNMKLTEKIVSELPRQLISDADFTRLHRIATGTYAHDDTNRHIEKHYFNDQIKEAHGVFTINPSILHDIIANLEMYTYKSLPVGVRKYVIPHPEAGYKGGLDGDFHTLNNITILTVLNNQYLITAYPSD